MENKFDIVCNLLTEITLQATRARDALQEAVLSAQGDFAQNRIANAHSNILGILGTTTSLLEALKEKK